MHLGGKVARWSAMTALWSIVACGGRVEESVASGGAPAGGVAGIQEAGGGGFTNVANGGGGFATGGGDGGSAEPGGSGGTPACAETFCCDPKSAQTMPAACGPAGEASCPKSDKYIGPTDACIVIEPTCELGTDSLQGQICAVSSSVCNAGPCFCQCSEASDQKLRWQCTCLAK